LAEPARHVGPFERAVREALEAEVSRVIADALLGRALALSRRARVPEEIGEFRAFVEDALCVEMRRVLDPVQVTLVLERLGHVLWMATSDVRALNVARDWTGRSSSAPSRESGPPRESGSRPRIAPEPLVAPSCVLVLTLDAQLVVQTRSEIAGRCPVVSVATPSDLARMVSRAGDRPVVLVDTALPSIEVPTFVGLCPILPPLACVVLWGADARQLARLGAQFPRAQSWIASAEARAPGLLALSV
jgi:hypothetical protein